MNLKFKKSRKVKKFRKVKKSRKVRKSRKDKEYMQRGPALLSRRYCADASTIISGLYHYPPIISRSILILLQFQSLII